MMDDEWSELLFVLLRTVADCRWFPAVVGNFLLAYVLLVAYSGHHIL